MFNQGRGVRPRRSMVTSSVRHTSPSVSGLFARPAPPWSATLEWCLSVQKFFHLVRLMGSSVSNTTLEVALFTRSNVCFSSVEASRDKRRLKDMTKHVADIVDE